MLGLGIVGTILVLGAMAVAAGIKIVQEYERVVVLRLGRLVSSRGPGMSSTPTSNSSLSATRP